MHAIRVDHMHKEHRLSVLQDLPQALLGTAARQLGAQVNKLFEVLSSISTPTSRCAAVNGRIAPHIETGTGFVPDFTSREKVNLHGSILRLRRREIDSKFDDIVAIAKTEQFIAPPVNRYSSNMQLKLAFSVAGKGMQRTVSSCEGLLSISEKAASEDCLNMTNYSLN